MLPREKGRITLCDRNPGVVPYILVRDVAILIQAGPTDCP
jgi:hypothetical protein